MNDELLSLDELEKFIDDLDVKEAPEPIEVETQTQKILKSDTASLATPQPFPTGKPSVSFSEISDWISCSYKHKLKHVLKISLDGPSPYTAFGSAVHAACESFLRSGVMDINVAFDELDKKWSDEINEASLEKKLGTKQDWKNTAKDILETVPAFMDETFPGWSPLSAEQSLFESIDGHSDVKFKGFIDAIIQVPDARGKKKYYVIDWKTASWGWKREKKQDFNVQLQLRLYKIFWAKKMGISPSDIRTAFVLLKRTGKKGETRCELVPVSVGDKTVERSLKVVNNMIASVRRGIALKNRNSCRFCEYKGTKHCP